LRKELRSFGRRERRSPLAVPVRFRALSQPGPQWDRAIALEINERGARLKVSAEIKSGQPLEIAPPQAPGLAARATVVWTRSIVGTQEAEMGVEFASPVPVEKWLASGAMEKAAS
jgi:hypothetical protein